jgi:hypothetical protein
MFHLRKKQRRILSLEIHVTEFTADTTIQFHSSFHVPTSDRKGQLQNKHEFKRQNKRKIKQNRHNQTQYTNTSVYI